MELQSEAYFEPLDRVEVLASPTGLRRWPDEVKGRLVAESFVAGVTVREVAERNGLAANRLSTWRGWARRGELTIPDLTGLDLEGADPGGADFAPVVLEDVIADVHSAGPGLGPIELETGGVTLRLDGNMAVARLAELVSALRPAP